jgi:AcrR family transcriptional regulator
MKKIIDKVPPTKDENIKSEILAKAQKLFMQYGLKKTTMDEIASECGKAKSTLYQYYRSKEEVFAEVLFLEMQNLRKIVKGYVDEAKTISDKVMTYFQKFHEEVMLKVNVYRLMKQELLNENILRVYFPKFMEFETAYLKRLLEDSLDAGDLKGIDRKDIPWISEILLASFFGIARYSIEACSADDSERIMQTARILITRMF